MVDWRITGRDGTMMMGVWRVRRMRRRRKIGPLVKVGWVRHPFSTEGMEYCA